MLSVKRPIVTADQLRLIEADFAATMAACAHLGVNHTPPPLITALSGGADSTALCLLAARYAARHNMSHRAIIIDHGLRSDSSAEAARVAARMATHDIPVDVMRIHQSPVGGGVQEWARHVRYDALLAVARRDDACLLFGHHAGDQAETIAMRLARGSGLSGLAGMAVTSWFHDVKLLRPMLAWPATTAVAVCDALGVAFEADPSNQDRRYERVRMRAMLAADHASQGPDSAALSSCLTRLAGLSARLCNAIDHPLSVYEPVIHPAGYAVIGPHHLGELPVNMWNRLMARLIRTIAAQPYPPAATALARLRRRFHEQQAATLGGCKFTPDAGQILVTREIGRQPIELDVSAGELVLFDNLWRIKAPVAGTLRPAAMPPQNRPDSAEKSPMWDHIRKNVPQQARIAIPVLDTLDGGRLYPQLTTKMPVMPNGVENEDVFSAHFISGNMMSGRVIAEQDATAKAEAIRVSAAV